MANNRILPAGLLAFFVLTGCCGPRNLFVLLPDQNGSAGQITVNNEQGTQVLSEPYQATEVSGAGRAPGPVYVMEEKDVTRTFKAALAAEPALPVSFLLYFKPGTAELTDESLRLLPEIITAIKNRVSPDISVIGHSDRVGTAEINRGISLERANAVAEALVSQGIGRDTLEISYHGEENPLIQTEDEVPEPRNRRVEVTIR